MFKKLLSSVLTLCLLVGSLFTAFPTAAVAAETPAVSSTNTTVTGEESSILKETVIFDSPKALWKYFADGTDPAVGLDDLHAWTAVDFDDSSWGSGDAPLGVSRDDGVDTTASPIYSSSSIKTLLPLTPEGETSKHYKGYFFRKTIDLSSYNLENYNALYIDVAMNDSIVLYINGNVVLNTCVDTEAGKTTNLYYSNGTLDQKQFRVYFDDYENLLADGKLVIAAEVHNGDSTPGDVYFAMNKLSLLNYQAVPYAAEMVVLTPGADQTMRNIAWLSNIAEAGEVRLAEKSAVKDGVFPTEHETFKASSDPTEVAFEKYAKKVTLTGLKEKTEYAYVIAAGSTVSKIYYFSTGSFSSFDFVFVGDPQLGNKAEHGEAWTDSMNKITTNFNPDFIVSAGDQIESAHSEQIYKLFITNHFASVPFAPTVGPGHETPFHNDAYTSYGDHYNLPNLSTTNGAGLGSADYWYVYNNTLFVHLNMAIKGSEGIEGHKKMMQEAVNANPDVTWRIAVMHNSLFSTSTHASASSTQTYRQYLVPAFEQYGFDMVLSGHDHVYVRTKVLSGTEPTDDPVVNNTVVRPNGIVYVCANSSTSTKHYGKKLTDTPFVASENYEPRKSAIRLVVTDESITMVSYFIDGDTPEVFDTFTIRNTEGEVLNENVTVTDKSVSLGELIDMNIYASIREDYTGTATLSCGNKTVEIDLATLTPNENGLYKLSISLTSIDMAKDVTLTIDGATYKTSIKEYLEELIDTSTNSYYTDIAKALLNYGAYAQEYFAEKNSDDSLLNVLPNESLSEADKTVPTLNVDDLKKYEFAATGVTEDVKFVSAALVLSSKTGIKLYFTASDGATVTVDGEACEKYSDRGMYYVVLNIPSPSLATSAFNVVINDGETVASTTFSVYTAIHAALSNPATNPKLVSLLNAYAAYCATTVIPASNKIIYNANGGILPTGAPTQPDLEKDIILPEPTKNGYAFAGWYTTEAFDAGTRIYSIPAGTLSDVTVYAKFVGVISDIDWDNIDDVNVTSANPDWYLQNSAGRNIFRVTVSGDSTAKTLTDTKNGKYLLVNTASQNPTMWLYANKYGFNQVIAKDVDCVSFTFRFSLDGTANPMYTLFQLRATQTASGASMSKHNNPFMLIDGSGNIKLADNGKTPRETFATLSADKITTVRLVIDFDKKQFRVYDENGNVIDTATMAIPSATGATTGQEYMTCLIQAMLYITTNKNSNGSALRIYGIQAAYTDIFAK